MVYYSVCAVRAASRLETEAAHGVINSHKCFGQFLHVEATYRYAQVDVKKSETESISRMFFEQFSRVELQYVAKYIPGSGL